MYSTSIAPIFFGSNAPVFFCGMPTTAVGPVDEAIRPTFICACAAKATSTAASAAAQRVEGVVSNMGGILEGAKWKETETSEHEAADAGAAADVQDLAGD